jgi:hypothetical protein
MSVNVYALVVVLAAGTVAFYIGKQIGRSFVTHQEFVAWRNAWFTATVVAFLSGTFFWAYALVAAILCRYARRVSPANLGVFFILLFAVPLGNVTIPGFGGMNMLFVVHNGRLLAIFLLLPILFASRKRNRASGAYSALDWLVVSYALLLIILEYRRSDLTNVMRAAVLDTLDIIVPYFAFSRAVTSVSDLRKVLLGFIIAVIPLSLIAPLEVVKGWHFYGSVSNDWGESFSIVRREGSLRASASAVDPICFGYVVMVAVGCLIGLWQVINPRRGSALFALIMFGAALVATLSRGPWMGTAALIVVYLGTGPNAFSNLSKLAVVLFITVTPLLLTPAIDYLPFVGSVDTGTVTYRQRLFDISLDLIERDPWIGSVNYLSTPEMMQLMQGEGIIDLVNTYVQIALISGLVGLGLFAGCFAAILIGLWRVIGIHGRRNNEITNCARILLASLVAILVTIGTVSSQDFIPYVYWSFAGLSVALIRISSPQKKAPTRHLPNIESGAREYLTAAGVERLIQGGRR